MGPSTLVLYLSTKSEVLLFCLTNVYNDALIHKYFVCCPLSNDLHVYNDVLVHKYFGKYLNIYKYLQVLLNVFGCTQQVLYTRLSISSKLQDVN